MPSTRRWRSGTILAQGQAGDRRPSRRPGRVTTACYAARRFGPRSAMPMFKALQLCPGAVVIPPNMDKYRRVSRQIRAILAAVTPVIEPVSLDEAYLDLNDAVRMSAERPATLLAGIALAVEREVGITISIGLGGNKFLAKLASDLDKPRGFAVIGRAEAKAFLAPLPVRRILGVGLATAAKLETMGIATIGDLQSKAPSQLVGRFGKFGRRLPSSHKARTIERLRRRGRPRASPLRPPFARTCARSSSSPRRSSPSAIALLLGSVAAALAAAPSCSS
ncbi:MAG: Y-family DNA polymerase [Allosphingosinicella sp.]